MLFARQLSGDDAVDTVPFRGLLNYSSAQLSSPGVLARGAVQRC